MKRSIITVLGIVLVIALIIVCVVFFRDGNRFTTNKADKADTTDDGPPELASKAGPGYTGKPDAASKRLAAILKKETGEDVSLHNIVSKGRPIKQGKYSFTVTSWKMGKESPGYPLPQGMTLEGTGVQLNGNGDITNDYSYVVVNVTVKNLTKKDVTELIWPEMRLQIEGASSDVGEIKYLGEAVPRKNGHNYYQETIKAKGEKSMPLIYIVKDEWTQGNKQMYLKINTLTLDAQSSANVYRYIVLN